MNFRKGQDVTGTGAHVDHNWDTVRVRIVLTIFAAAAVVAAIAVSVFLIVGPERVWNLFGPPDLGPVKFETSGAPDHAQRRARLSTAYMRREERSGAALVCC